MNEEIKNEKLKQVQPIAAYKEAPELEYDKRVEWLLSKFFRSLQQLETEGA